METEPLVFSFTNTVDARPGFREGDYVISEDALDTVEALMQWAESHDLVSSRSKAVRAAPLSPQDHRDLIELREFLFRFFSTLASDRRISQADLESLNDLLRPIPGEILVRDGDSLELGLPPESATSKTIKHAILISARNILIAAGKNLDRLKVCGSPDCGWIFLDTSKAGKRRWCDMSECGNRAKARRFYRRGR